jgi:hypothetical protein
VSAVFRYIRFLPPRLGNPIAAPESWRAGAFATLIQEVDAYLAWAEKHADMVTQPRYVTLQRALADAFPCPKWSDRRDGGPVVLQQTHCCKLASFSCRA